MFPENREMRWKTSARFPKIGKCAERSLHISRKSGNALKNCGTFPEFREVCGKTPFFENFSIIQLISKI
jgi:hypothetical protein